MGWWRSLTAELFKNVHRRRLIKQAREEAEAMERARREFAKRYPNLVERRNNSEADLRRATHRATVRR